MRKNTLNLRRKEQRLRRQLYKDTSGGEYPELVIITRLSDKFYRLKTLLEGAEQQVKSESIDDTLLDLANYCLMEILERQNGKEEKI